MCFVDIHEEEQWELTRFSRFCIAGTMFQRHDREEYCLAMLRLYAGIYKHQVLFFSFSFQHDKQKYVISSCCCRVFSKYLNHCRRVPLAELWAKVTQKRVNLTIPNWAILYLQYSISCKKYSGRVTAKDSNCHILKAYK